MTKLERIAQIVGKIKPVEEKDDGWNACDASGGNYDDAYSIGLDDGEGYLAEMIREIINDNNS